MKLLVVSLIVLLTVACQSKDMYYWGSYENTLYDYRKEPSEINLTKHKKQLEKILEVAAKKKKRIPPGIHFELAMIEAKLGNHARSIELLQIEKSTFPEATHYVNRAINQIGGAE